MQVVRGGDEMSFWASVTLELIKAIFLLGVLSGVGVVTSRVISRKWEQQKLSSELTVDYMKQFWGRLHAVARWLGKGLTSDLKGQSSEARQEAFYTFIDFRVTLFRFVDEASGWLPGINPELEQRTVRLLDDLFQRSQEPLSRRDVSWILAELGTGERPLVPYHRFVELVESGSGVLCDSFQKFDGWIAADEGRVCAETGRLFKEYAEAMAALIKTVFPMY